MKKINFNSDWQFIFEKNLESHNTYGFDKYMEATGAAAQFYDFSNWNKITLPHDFAVALPKNLKANTMAGARPNSHYCRFYTEHKTNLADIYNVGWYRKQFKVDTEFCGKRIFIEFEGVFRDATVWVNGVYIDRHTSGYTSFSYEITDHLIFGEDNSIAVRVDTEQPEGWWYEGGGIYRNVWLIVGEPLYFKLNQTVVDGDTDGNVHVSTAIINDTYMTKCDTLILKVVDSEDKTVSEEVLPVAIDSYEEKTFETYLIIKNPKLWDIDTPNLYKLKLSLTCAGEETEEMFGLRKIELNPEKGLLLNEKPIKIRGACVHQDFAGVGIALTDNLNYYKIKQLKEMGVNAYRCSHHAPSPSILRACDELGMLVMDETRMFGTSPEAMNQLKSLIERDRNHPSVFIWCIGNEEFSIQADDRCAAMTRKITRFIKSLDKTNRPITYGANNGENFTGINTEIEVRGINYIRIGSHGLWVDKYHEEHPETPIIATEESSYVLSRGASNVDFGSNLLDTTGNVAMSWGSTPFGWMKYYEERPYLLGGFMWTGFDYRGEANPFALTNVSSSFGAIDLCGIPKPIFYYYQSQWTDKPVLKLAPHWNYEVGEEVTVQIYTNLEKVTVYINDKEIGSYCPEKYGIISVNTVFEPGTIRTEGLWHGERVSDCMTTSGEVDSLRLVNVLDTESENDIGIIQIEAIDKSGNVCHFANNKIDLDISDGEIVGVGNGDPADLEPEQFPAKTEALYLRLFNTSDGFYSVPPKTQNKRYADFHFIENEELKIGFDDRERIVSDMIENFPGSKTEAFYTTVTLSEEYDYIEFERIDSEATVYVNGTKVGDNLRSSRSCVYDRHTRPYRFYCKLDKGKNEIRVEATLKNHNRYPFSGYVKIEKILKPEASVRLHYGKARVFVKTKSQNSLTAKFLER